MPSLFARTFSLFLLALACIQPAHAEVDWDPKNTWVFIVGLLTFENSDEYGSFPQKNRRDVQLLDYFKSIGVPADQIVYLQDEKARLATIESAFSKFLDRTDENSLLVVYYCGHGFPDDDNEAKVYFASYDASVGDVTGWSVDRMVAQIESSFQGSDALLLADCCHSGALSNVAKRKGSEVNYVCLSSSTLRKSSTGTWTFTESLLAALRGDPETDLDQDGSVTLKEAHDFAKAEMEFGEDQKTSWFVSEEWSGPETLADARERTDPRIGAHVEVNYGKKSYKGRVTDRKDDQYKVFFYGFEDTEAEWVNEKEIQWQE